MIEIFQLIVMIAGFVLALIRLKEVKESTNGRMQELIDLVKDRSFAEGKESERAKND